jgi:squalene-hopene/tetraprenyl-beta-curcumene cyclase
LTQQRDDGAWVPLWFGNQDDPKEENPVYGTSKVLLALTAMRSEERFAAEGREPALRRGVHWLVEHQNKDGGWGGQVAWDSHPGRDGKPKKKRRVVSSVEETALAVEALLAATDARVSSDGLAFSGDDPDEKTRQSLARGLAWLVGAVEENKHRETSPIGFYFAKLWYYEKLYPMTFTASALGQAVGSFAPPATRRPLHAHR